MPTIPAKPRRPTGEPDLERSARRSPGHGRARASRQSTSGASGSKAGRAVGGDDLSRIPPFGRRSLIRVDGRRSRCRPKDVAQHHQGSEHQQRCPEPLVRSRACRPVPDRLGRRCVIARIWVHGLSLGQSRIGMLGVGLPELPTRWRRRPLWIGRPPRRGSPSYGLLRPARRGPEAPSTAAGSSVWSVSIPAPVPLE